MAEAPVLGAPAGRPPDLEARLAAFYFAYFCYMGAFGTFFPLWLSQRGYTAGEVAAVLVLPQVLRIVAPHAWAHVADRWGTRRNVVAILSVLAMAGCALIGLTSTLAEVFVAVALMGLFAYGVLPVVEATALAALSNATGRYGPVRLWGSIGFIASVLGVGALLDVQPVAVLIPAVVALMALAVAAAVRLPPQPPKHAGAQHVEFGGVLRQPAVVALLAACFCMMVAHAALYGFYTLHLVGQGYSTTVVGALWTLGVVAEIAVFARLPWLLGRHSHRAVLLASFAAAALRFAVIGWGASSLALLAAVQLLHGLTFAAYHAASVGLVQRLFPGPLEVRGQALYASLTYGAGGVCGMLLAGWAWQAAGPEVTFTLSALFGALGGLIVARKLKVASPGGTTGA